MRPRRPSPTASIIAVVLAVSLVGVGLAAGLSVGGGAKAATKPIATRGPRAIVAQITNVAGKSASTPAGATLAEATWTQRPGELNELIGQVTIYDPEAAECEPGKGEVRFLLDGVQLGSLRAQAEVGKVGREGPLPMQLEPGSEESIGWIFQPEKAVTHTFSVTASDECGTSGGKGGGHFTVSPIYFDVLASRP